MVLTDFDDEDEEEEEEEEEAQSSAVFYNDIDFYLADWL
jgi:hypothetical protein